MKTSESIKNISEALLKAQANMGAAVKGAKNPFFKSNYADLNAVREACLPLLNDNGITVIQPTTTIDQDNYVETTLLHSTGEFLSSLTKIICPKQNDPQAYGLAISYARRYGLVSFLCIGAEDDDGEKSMDRPRLSITKKNDKPMNADFNTIVDLYSELEGSNKLKGLNEENNKRIEWIKDVIAGKRILSKEHATMMITFLKQIKDK